jgi:lipoprotein-releasing system permease protein
MLVLEKKKEIAVIKAMGATDAQLLRAFVYQGLVIGLVGTGLGLGLGYGVCRWLLAHGIALDPKVYFIDHLPVRLRPEEFVFTGGFALLVCLLATIWPALYAARLRPLDAFREG